jgi:hypothetical protein
MRRRARLKHPPKPDLQAPWFRIAVLEMGVLAPILWGQNSWYDGPDQSPLAPRQSPTLLGDFHIPLGERECLGRSQEVAQRPVVFGNAQVGFPHFLKERAPTKTFFNRGGVFTSIRRSYTLGQSG